ncbi:CHASE2 domain-containing protein [Alkalinema pantanalense CENA528]|uniref:CHASE2 domain-containing protein n=1 Tax=Alkalinema pantanalense TaxID=1620705 RepID=UPI003D6FACF0
MNRLTRLTTIFHKPRVRLSLMALGVTCATIVAHRLGTLQGLEQGLLNHWFRLRPVESRTVPVVMVTFGEADLKQAGGWPVPDRPLAQLLQRIKRDRPAAIGLDLYRDLPIAPGHDELLQVFATTPNLIGITKAVGNGSGPVVPPPPLLADRGQIAVNDLLLDTDGVVRRNLLAIDKDGKNTLALGTKLALMYLKQRGVKTQGGHAGTCTQVGSANFCRLEANAGGYVHLDNGGNQILANYLRIPGGIPQVSYTQLMTQSVPTSFLQDKIVLVGATADSLWGDRFYTPYTTDSSTTWAGVEIHANLAAQIVSSVLDRRPILQGVPEVWQWFWISAAAGFGVVLGWSLRSPRWLIIGIPGAIGGILGTSYGLFLLGWWLVALSPLLALLGAGLLSRSYRICQTLQQTHESLAQHLEQQVEERTQALLQKTMALEQAKQLADKVNQTLERLARMDELTQVANRRCFNEYLEQEWQRMLREQAPLSLILMDIDFFKLYNDTYGHPAGDECLAKVAKGVKTALKRPTDLAARYGGEEFAVILPNTPIAGAVQIAQEIQANIQSLQIAHGRSQVSTHVTLSMGIASTVPMLETLPAQLLEQADHNLYQAKMAGRNRAIAAPLDLSSPTPQVL